LLHGIDVEVLHMDVCTRLPLFRESAAAAPGADRAAEAVQLPVYASLTDEDIARVAPVARSILSRGTAGVPVSHAPASARQ
jgi:hypothetical protein